MLDLSLSHALLREQPPKTFPRLLFVKFLSIVSLQSSHLSTGAMFSSSLPFLITALSLVGRATSQSCWFPDGVTQAQSDVACDSNAETSACCGPNSFCLSNGLCYIDGAVSRGSCTDKNWGPGCSEFCADGKNNAPCVTDTFYL